MNLNTMVSPCGVSPCLSHMGSCIYELSSSSRAVFWGWGTLFFSFVHPCKWADGRDSSIKTTVCKRTCIPHCSLTVQRPTQNTNVCSWSASADSWIFFKLFGSDLKVQGRRHRNLSTFILGPALYLFQFGSFLCKKQSLQQSLKIALSDEDLARHLTLGFLDCSFCLFGGKFPHMPPPFAHVEVSSLCCLSLSSPASSPLLVPLPHYFCQSDPLQCH